MMAMKGGIPSALCFPTNEMEEIMISKKLFVIICVAATMLFGSTPVQAAVNACPPHTPREHLTNYQYDINVYQHREWTQEYDRCTVCGEHLDVGPWVEGNWEDHNWVIDWSTADDIGHGLIFYDAQCSVCGYSDTVANP